MWSYIEVQLIRLVLLFLAAVHGVNCRNSTTCCNSSDGRIVWHSKTKQNYEIYSGRNQWNFPRPGEGGLSKLRTSNLQPTFNQTWSPKFTYPPSKIREPQHKYVDKQPAEDLKRQNAPRSPRPRYESQASLHKFHYRAPLHHMDKGHLILGSSTYEYQKPPTTTKPHDVVPYKKPAHPHQLYLAAGSPPCKDGFDTLVADLTLISILSSFVSLILAGVSLIMSNFYNVFGSGASVLFAGLPSFILNLLSLVDIALPSEAPFVIIITIVSIFDFLNNFLSVVPGSLLSDLIGLISILIGKVSFGLGTMSSYPQLLGKTLKFLGLKDLVDIYYGCKTKSLGKLVQNYIKGLQND